MPELPEVQTIVDDLNRKVIGFKIVDAWTDWAKTIKTHKLADFVREIKGRKIIKAHRRAKYIMMDLSGGKTLIIHQKISGHLLYGKWENSQIPTHKLQTNSNTKILNSKPKTYNLKTITSQQWVSTISGPLRDDPQNQYIRFILFLNNGWMLGLSDLRRFGKVFLGDTDKIENINEIGKLGPEPLDPKFTLAKFKELMYRKMRKVKPRGQVRKSDNNSKVAKLAHEAESSTIRSSTPKRFRSSGAAIKKVLMDPFTIVGIGNIYGDEILWYAGISPTRPVEKLTDRELEVIYKYMKLVLQKAIKAQGDSQQDYRKLDGTLGKYQNMQVAYHETGNKCQKRDGGVIKRVVINNRSAHYCPIHQR